MGLLLPLNRSIVLAMCSLAGATLSMREVTAQELEPRNFANTPVGLNFVLGGYAYTTGDVVFSASSPLTDGEVQTHSGLLAYVRSFDLGGLSAKAGVFVPYAGTSGSATAAGQTREREVHGFADPKFRITVNLFGAPALSLEEFARYKQDLIVGVVLDVTAPLGQYDPSKFLNIGTNRWSFNPELGISKALGDLTLEGSVAATVFARNSNFFGGQTLEQDPLFSVQSHVIYEFRPGFWASFDATYYTGGSTTIDGQVGESLENARLGVTAALTVSRNNSIKVFGSTGVYSRRGADFDAIGVAWQLRWGGGL